MLLMSLGHPGVLPNQTNASLSMYLKSCMSNLMMMIMLISPLCMQRYSKTPPSQSIHVSLILHEQSNEYDDVNLSFMYAGDIAKLL